jgi:hypothetical protein
MTYTNLLTTLHPQRYNCTKSNFNCTKSAIAFRFARPCRYIYKMGWVRSKFNLNDRGMFFVRLFVCVCVNEERNFENFAGKQWNKNNIGNNALKWRVEVKTFYI